MTKEDKKRGLRAFFFAVYLMMAASIITEVLTTLENIITDSRRRKDRLGIFASLYYKVTARVKEGIDKKEFSDGARMEKLDVIFANRYLTALEIWQAGGEPSACWKTAFEATRSSSALVLQHLLLGINAHINLDLGIAAVETMKGQSFPDIEKDFDSINTIISSLTYEVINDINRLSPLISLIGLHSAKTESILIQFSITNARDGAWCFAEDLNKQSGPGYPALIEARDKSINTLAAALVHFRGTLRFTIWLIHLFEWKDPARIIDLLHGYKKTFIKVNTAGAASPAGAAGIGR